MITLSGDPYTSKMSLGFSNQVLVWVSAGGFTVIFIILGYFLIKIPANETGDRNRRHPNDPSRVDLLGLRGEEYDDALLQANVSTLNRAQRRARAKLQMKKYRRLETAVPRQNVPLREPIDAEHDDVIQNFDRNNNQDPQGEDWNQEIDDDMRIEGDEGGQRNENSIVRISSTLSRKERQKLAKVQEREERRAYENMRRENARVLDEELSRKKREKERTAHDEQVILAQQRKEMAIADQERKRMMFVQDENHTKDSSMTVEDFIKLLSEQKRISVVEMANRLSVSVSDLVDRLRELEDDDRMAITGIFDKNHEYYTLLSHDDMRSIITRLEESGPISLSSFSEVCQNILSPTGKMT